MRSTKEAVTQGRDNLLKKRPDCSPENAVVVSKEEGENGISTRSAEETVPAGRTFTAPRGIVKIIG